MYLRTHAHIYSIHMYIYTKNIHINSIIFENIKLCSWFFLYCQLRVKKPSAFRFLYWLFFFFFAYHTPTFLPIHVSLGNTIRFFFCFFFVDKQVMVQPTNKSLYFKQILTKNCKKKFFFLPNYCFLPVANEIKTVFHMNVSFCYL